jgi:hypothetical protein
MATNVYFNHFSYGREQDLIEDLTIEAIKVYGHDLKYIPRTIVARDNLYGEDSLSTFNDAADVEMYIKNVEGFDGEGDLLSRFGLQIRDEMTFTVARKRFDQIRTEKLMTEVGYNYLNEDADTNSPSRQFLTGNNETESIILEQFLTGNNETESIILESGTANGYSITTNRPTEGDLIYFPMVDKLFEIKFVEHEQIFYQTGRLQTYDIRCELFEYSSERLDTGYSEIDGVEDQFSLDVLANELLLDGQDGGVLGEDGDAILVEFTIEDQDVQANNDEIFRQQIVSDDIIDFSEADPWSEGRF